MPADRAICELAGRQHGRVARRQLLALGVSDRAIQHRIRIGRLIPEHPGVYAVGHRVRTHRGRWMAAVLAAGPGAALSHRSAAGLHRQLPPGGAIHVTAPGRRTVARVIVHRRRLPADEVMIIDAIPVTTPPRTSFDLAETEPPLTVEAAINEAEYLRLTDRLSLVDMLARHPNQRGAATVRAILEAGDIGRRRTRNDFERSLLALVDVARLPRPVMNQPLVVAGRHIEPDAMWPEQRLAVELDGWRSHRRRAKRETDVARDRRLQVAGWRVVRVTWRQLERDRASLTRDLADLLAQPS